MLRAEEKEINFETYAVETLNERLEYVEDEIDSMNAKINDYIELAKLLKRAKYTLIRKRKCLLEAIEKLEKLDGINNKDVIDSIKGKLNDEEEKT